MYVTRKSTYAICNVFVLSDKLYFRTNVANRKEHDVFNNISYALEKILFRFCKVYKVFLNKTTINSSKGRRIFNKTLNIHVALKH